MAGDALDAITPPDPASLAAAAAYAAGMRDHGNLRIAVAIAGGESGWRPSAMGDTTITDATWGPSVGLWQIRSLKAQSGTGAARDATKLTDPLFNARSMIEVSGGGQNWRPWSVYTSGAYTAHLDAGDTAARWAIAAMSTPQGIEAVTRGIGGAAGDIAAGAVAAVPGLGNAVDLAGKAGQLVTNPKLLLRGAMILAGGLVAFVGLWQVLRPEAREVLGAAAAVVPGGKAATAMAAGAGT